MEDGNGNSIQEISGNNEENDDCRNDNDNSQNTQSNINDNNNSNNVSVKSMNNENNEVIVDMTEVAIEQQDVGRIGRQRKAPSIFGESFVGEKSVSKEIMKFSHTTNKKVSVLIC